MWQSFFLQTLNLCQSVSVFLSSDIVSVSKLERFVFIIFPVHTLVRISFLLCQHSTVTVFCVYLLCQQHCVFYFRFHTVHVNNTLATSRQIGYTLRKTFPNLPCHFHKYLISLFSFSQYFWEHWLTEVQCFSRRVGIVRVFICCVNSTASSTFGFTLYMLLDLFKLFQPLRPCMTMSVSLDLFTLFSRFGIVCHSFFFEKLPNR